MWNQCPNCPMGLTLEIDQRISKIVIYCDHIVSNSLQPLVTRGCPASREAVEQFLIALRATSAALAVPRSCPASHLSHQHRFHRVHRPRAHQISTSRISLTSLTSNDRHLAMNCFQFRFQLAITFCFSVASKPLY